ncbi:MAG: GGDEF domain-containing protein [Myxococcota bacterium]
MTSPSEMDLERELSRIDTYPLRRRSGDLFERSLVGPIFYVLASLLLLAVSDYWSRWGAWSLAPAGFFLATWAARVRHRLPADDDLPRWTRRHWLIIHTGSLAWGLVPAFVGWNEARPDSAILVASLSTMAFCTATSHSFATHPSHARVTMLLLFLPGVTVFLLAAAELRSTGLTLFVYGFYLLANLRRSAREYERQLETEVALLRSRAEVSALSLTDALTGLANRRGYEQAWARVASTSLREGRPVALLVFDLDHFKQVNDRRGHVGGDECLRHFATLLRGEFRRDSDFLARLGGEEFIALLPGLDEAAARARAEALRQKVQATPCRFDGVEIPLSVSGGLAMLDVAAPDSTFKRADAACYAAKDAGRNCIVAWSPSLRA